ncbi:BON domain-containing protein [Piscinibacter terrae]|uniref:BON domain-containing protein n=1 Tax=Piscinibacter terrae TaxID=2496871 RepID=A0A3N7HSW0_9BURK|nr:BON domain-containing protein [Albitalea terrae]RQP24853.1 BON domain-containing protein [Albitalea terrae]
MARHARPWFAVALALAAGFASAEERANYFNDPFLQLTSGIASCPVPEGPLITETQRREQAHGRIERGTSCFQAGRCRLPNAYLYDKEIIPRVKKAVDFAANFADTSVWAEGQRRWVWLKGCVRSQEQSDALERLVRSIDDVENVINQLTIVPTP